MLRLFWGGLIGGKMDNVLMPSADLFSISFCRRGHSTRTLSPTRNHLRLKAQTTPPKTMATMPKTNRKISLKDTPRMKSNFSVQRRFQKAEMKLSAEQVRSQILQNAMIIAEIPRRKRIRLRAYPNLLFLSTFFILILSLS